MSGDLASLLLRSGAVSDGARFTPLTGGVSSEIVRVERAISAPPE